MTMSRFSWKFLCSTLFLITVGASTDICDSQCHCLEYKLSSFIVSCKGYKNHQPDINFDEFDWPKIENRTIQAFFSNLSIHLLPKISGDATVVSINFDDNLIRTLPSNPFEYFTNLESISIANNLISELTRDFLKSATSLKILCLSNNSLSDIDPIVVSHLKQLREINLSFNEFTKLSADLTEALSFVEIMKIENNKLFTIDNGYNGVDFKLKQLFLSNNQFSVVTSTMLNKFINLETIDFSNNKITNIDENAFTSLKSLKLLDLSDNKIRRISARLPDTLELLSMANNQLVTWPLLNTPKNLAELELQHNNLELIFPKDFEVDSLKILDVSYNHIDHLPNTQFFKLQKLDLSYNQFSSVPQNLNSMSPLLLELILDANPIKNVYFGEKTTLELLSLSYIPTLEELEAGAFTNLVGIRDNTDKSGTCVVVHISHNENLREISDQAFDGTSFCHLDLSYNNLVTIPYNLTDWGKIQEGIDLQGNPLSCNCEDQWMIDQILNRLYLDENVQYLLHDLKCQSPEDLQDTRFVQFLYHDKPFCGGNGAKKMDKIVEQASFGGISLSSLVPEDKNIRFELTHGPGFVIIICMSVIVLVVMILVGIRWQRDQNRKLAMRNRLYAYEDGYDY